MSPLLSRRWLAPLLLLIALAIVAALWPGTSRAQTNATLSGVVSDATNNAVLSGARVTLETGDAVVDTTTTNASGQYSFSGLTDGDYYDVDTADSGLVVGLNEAEVTSSATVLNVSLEPALYSGTITDHPSGYGLYDADVELLDSGGYLDQTYADANGYYAFPESDYESGQTYYIEASGEFGNDGYEYATAYYSSASPTGSATPGGATTFTPASASGGKQGLNVSVTALTGVISGKVTDASGTVSGASIAAVSDPETQAGGDSVTSSTGTYVVPVDGTGSFSVEATPPTNAPDVAGYYGGASDQAAATLVNATSTTETSGTNIALGAAATISGVLTTGSGTAVPDAEVELETAGGKVLATTTASASGVGEGDYTFGGLSAGTYYVYVNTATSDANDAVNDLSQWYGATGGSAAATLESAATPVTVSAGSGATANVALAQGGEVTGTISDSASGVGLAAGAHLVPVAPATALAVTVTSNRTSGSYTIYGVAPGTYDEYVEAPNGSDYDHYDTFTTQYSYYDDAFAWYGGASLAQSSGTASPVTVTASTTTSISFALPAAAEIIGTVTANGQATQGVLVEAYDSLGSLLGENLGRALTASDGTYEISNLLPGAYKVGFAPQATPGATGTDANLAFQFYNGQSTLVAASALALSAGQATTGINANLVAGGEITGTVTSDATQKPLAGLTVDLLDASGDVLDSAETRGDGTYTLAGIPAGSYYVEFDASGTADQTQFYGGTQVLSGSTAVSVTSGQTTSGINAALAPATAAAISGPTSTVTTPAATVTSPAPAPTTVTHPTVGRPTVSGLKLAGIGTRKVTLTFKLAAGTHAAKLKSVAITLPKGFTFVSKALKRDLKLGAKASYTLVKGVLTVSLKSAETSVTVSLKAGAISVIGALASQAKRRKLASAKITLVVVSSSGVKTTLIETVKQPA